MSITMSGPSKRELKRSSQRYNSLMNGRHLWQ